MTVIHCKKEMKWISINNIKDSRSINIGMRPCHFFFFFLISENEKKRYVRKSKINTLQMGLKRTAVFLSSWGQKSSYF